MLVYGQMYSRNLTQHARNFWTELSCLNNRVVFVLPPWETVKARFQKRGDDFQTEESLSRLYTLFEDQEWISNLPNVIHVENDTKSVEETTHDIVAWNKTKEECDLDDIASEVLRYVSNIPSTSAKDCEVPLSFTFFEDLDFPEADPEILDDDVEGDYFKGILEKMTTKMTNELNGKNEYNEKQTSTSRRFIYTDDTCISLIHILFRDNIMDVNVNLRSSNVAKTFRKDLEFIYYLASVVHEKYNLGSPVEAKFSFSLNSAHLVR